MKIKDEQLTQIQKQQKDLHGMLNNIWYLESQKHGLLHQFNELTKEVNDFKNQLENEYGEVNINIETGEYTLIEKENKEVPELKVVENV